MNYFTLFPLSGYWGKFLGFAISALALVLLVFQELAGPAFLASWFAPGKQVAALLWFFAIGLLFLTFSKEKIDDERVQKIRYTALRALAYFCLLSPAMFFAPFLNPEDGPGAATNETVPWIMLLLVLPLLVYQVIFNIGLFFNPSWIYNDLGAEENIRKNPRFFLIYILLVTVLFIGFFVLKAIH
jgi:hypothetical protein